MNKIKVANIIEEGRLGGPQVRIAEVSKRLKSLGIDNTVVYPFLNCQRFTRRLMDYGIRSTQFPLRGLTRQKKGLALYCVFFVFELILLYRYFRKEKFDIIHVSGGSWQFKGLIAGKLARCKVLWHLNDTKAPVFFRYFFKIIYRLFADGLIVAGEKVRNYYVTEMGVHGKPVYEIQAPVDTSYFNPHILKNKRRILSGDGLNIVSVGNINPAKGFEIFIHMAGLLKNMNGLNFYIIGPHFETQKAYSRKLLTLKNKLKIRNLNFFGASDNIRDVLNETDIYICSSDNEASPVSVWEAMSMGKAIVSTDVGDVVEFIKNGRSGFIVPRGSPDSLAEKVKILANDRDLMHRFGFQARKRAMETLDADIIAEKHRHAYFDIAGIKLQKRASVQANDYEKSK